MSKASPRKAAILAAFEDNAADRQMFRRRAAFFHQEDLRYLRFLIPAGLRVLEIGCGTGEVLAGLKPSYGLGVDFSPAMIAQFLNVRFISADSASQASRSSPSMS